MNVLVQKTLEGKWIKLNDEQVAIQKDLQRSRFSQYSKELAGKSVKLRDISTIINNFPNEEAFNFCANYINKAYGDIVKNSSLLALAGRPLYYLFGAPKADKNSMPYFANSILNQCYINDSFFSNPEITGKLLICITSRTHTLSMPLPVFHSYASRHFDAILYFFDPERNHYKEKADALSKNAEDIIKHLNPNVIAFLGTSAGACPAINLFLGNKESRVIAGSPVFDMYPKTAENLLKTNQEWLSESFVATHANNAIDSKFIQVYNALSKITGPKNIRDMSKVSSSHASLGSTLITEEFDKLLEWLSQSNSNINT